MSKKSYAVNVSLILGISVLLMLFIFVLVAHHRGVLSRVEQQRAALLATGSSALERIKIAGQAASVETQQAPVKIVMTASKPVLGGQEVYQASCIACHGAGIAGAPKLGDKGQWEKRIAKGLDTLYASSVNGVQGSAGVMPAKGGNPALSDAEVKAAVDYMVGQSK